MTRKREALKAANLFTAISGGVMFPHDIDEPSGPYTVIHCSDAAAEDLARRMRVQHALVLMGYDQDASRHAAETAWPGSARVMLDCALRNIA